MKAFIMKAIGQVGFMEKPIPHPGPNDAVVKTSNALICTSDSHTVGGAIGPRENLTLGHEAVGIVHEVGSNVLGRSRLASWSLLPIWWASGRMEILQYEGWRVCRVLSCERGRCEYGPYSCQRAR